MRLVTLLFIVAATTGGCSTMMLGTDAMRGSVSDAVEEDQTHLTTARAAATMPDMLTEVDRHETRMTGIMGDMTEHMSSMHGCSGIDSMMGLRDDMKAEMAAHYATMRGMTNVVDARGEVEHHVGTMTTMMDNMDSMLDGMHCN